MCVLSCYGAWLGLYYLGEESNSHLLAFNPNPLTALFLLVRSFLPQSLLSSPYLSLLLQQRHHTSPTTSIDDINLHPVADAIFTLPDMHNITPSHTARHNSNRSVHGVTVRSSITHLNSHSIRSDAFAHLVVIINSPSIGHTARTSSPYDLQPLTLVQHL